MSSDSHDVPKMVGTYKKLFLLLVVVTIIGMIVSLAWHVPVWLAVSLAIVIILCKSSIVYDSFKPLLSGKSVLIMVFALTAMFFLVLLTLPFFNHEGYIVGTQDLSKQIQMDEKPVEGHHHGG